MLVAARGDLFGVPGVAADACGGRAGAAASADTGLGERFAFLLRVRGSGVGVGRSECKHVLCASRFWWTILNFRPINKIF